MARPRFTCGYCGEVVAKGGGPAHWAEKHAGKDVYDGRGGSLVPFATRRRLGRRTSFHDPYGLPGEYYGGEPGDLEPPGGSWDG